MGHIFVKAELEGNKSKEEVEMLVDTGATYSVIPEEIANRIGVPKLRSIKVRLADGREIETDAGTVKIKIKNREALTTVLIMGKEALLGVETLEVLGLKVNPKTGELEETRTFSIRLRY